jgi:hypothetical protein
MRCTNPVRLRKTKTRVIELRLPLDLLDALREMGLAASGGAQ